MVAKINRGSSLYGALSYNQEKIDAKKGRFLYGNRIISAMTNNPDEDFKQTLRSFDSYLTANKNTEKPILHISLNPSPDDTLTDEKLSALARDYMNEMNYADQPYAVYLHEDTGRRHIHIVSTCVKENGKKIDDSYEWNRSMKACRQLELKYGLKQVSDKKEEIINTYLHKVDHRKGNLKQQVSNVLKTVRGTYRYQSFGEYSAMLSCFNIEAKQVRGDYKGSPYTGVIYSVTDDSGKVKSPPFKSSLFGKEFGEKGLTRRMKWNTSEFKKGKYKPVFKSTVAKARDQANSPEEFRRMLQSSGLDVVFRRNETGRIYGVTFIDHTNKEVYNGSRLGKGFSANVFENLFDGQGANNTKTIHNEVDQSLSAKDLSQSITEAFGINLFEIHGDDPEEQKLMRRKTKKKKRYRP